MKRIPEETRIQQINSLPNTSFVRWDGEYKNNTSKAVCRCLVDGFEWATKINNLLSGGKWCPQCNGGGLRVGRRRRTAEERVSQINALPNISFVRWESVYISNKSKAVCRCAIDGFEWSASVNSLVDKSRGCPKCAGGKTPCPQAERERQINSKPNIEFVRWANGYKNQESKAVCKCLIDDYEWATSVAILIHHGSGCPRCAGRVSPPSEKVEGMINAKPNISFVRWADGYKNKGSKAICRCAVDDFEWPVSAYSLIDNGTGCPKCAKKGYDPSKRGTLYILRSECGSRVKIGISNDHKQRHRVLKRETPFNWHCIELLHSDDGSLIAELEKELHSWTEQAEFREPFDGYTEWRKWDDRIPMWIEEYRARA